MRLALGTVILSLARQDKAAAGLGLEITSILDMRSAVAETVPAMPS